VLLGTAAGFGCGSKGGPMQGSSSQVTPVIRKLGYFHLGSCVSNSVESLLLLVPTLTQDVHIRAGNAVVAPPALIQSWTPAWVASRVAGHCSTPGPPHHASVESGVKSSESTVPHAKCALGVIRFKRFH